MYSESDIDAAVAAGALSAEAADGLRSFVARSRAAPAVDEEQFRLLTGFNDIFVSIAAGLILVAVAWLSSGLGRAGPGAGTAVVAWGLAEYFTRRRRMALPSLILLLCWTGGLFATTAAILLDVGMPGFDPAASPARLAACAALTAAGTYAHWRRFKVPITVAAGTAAGLGTVIALLLGLVPALLTHWPLLLFVGGLGVFALAMRWDISDRSRTTRRADVAFWLHLCAAPLLVHPLFKMLGLVDATQGTTGSAVAVLAIYLVLAVVALMVDRRALLVSALFYVLYALTKLVSGTVGSETVSLALTALMIGSALLLLSAFWHRARVALVRRLPVALQAWLPVT